MSTEDIQPLVRTTDSIDHVILSDMLRITMLIYNYGKNITLPMNDKDDDKDDQTIKTFVSELHATDTFENLKLNETRKKILMEIAKSVPSGKLCEYIEDTDTDLQAGITISKGKKRICVVFRGSESNSDWYYDMMIMKHKLHDDIYVHSGFHLHLTKNNTYNKILDKLSLLTAANPDFQVYITGHSLGGALATLFGYMISDTIQNQIIVASFASPRVGNYKWKLAFDSKENLTHYRITNKRDIITAFPYYKYYHVGINIQLSDTKCHTFDQSYIKNWYDESILTCWSAYEHDCDLYYDRLLKNSW
jgi:predicted lipase